MQNMFTWGVCLALSLFLPHTALAESFTLTSSDIKSGQYMAKAHEYTGFGCTGDNLSPQLSWHGAPEGTRAYAVFAYDPDAPTGSGWWHWQVVNLPASTTSLPTGAGSNAKNNLPVGATQIENDYGEPAFGGACPPVGDGAHRYRFTVFALSKKLELPTGASGALTGYMVNAHSLASASIETLYKR